MADDAGTRLRNVSDYGDIEVPDLGMVVEARHEIVVADADLAQRLIDTGAFIPVSRPGPKPASDSATTSSDASSATTTSTPSGAGTDTTSTEGTDQ